MKGLILAVLLALALTMCTPTAPCACPPSTTSAILFGRVTASGGAPVAGVAVETEVYGKACGVVPTYPTNVGQRAGPTDGDGRYRVEVRSFASPTTDACAEAAVIRGADTIRGPLLRVALRAQPPLDSVRIDVVLP